MIPTDAEFGKRSALIHALTLGIFSFANSTAARPNNRPWQLAALAGRFGPPKL
jgi:hypothetical protein